MSDELERQLAYTRGRLAEMKPSFFFGACFGFALGLSVMGFLLAFGVI